METVADPPDKADDAVPVGAQPGYRYIAFISYRHSPNDRHFAKWLHGQIERYRTPRELVEKGARAKVGRVFRDEEELAASADLSAEIEHALQQSQYLIVICSRLTPESRWVNEEIRRFRSFGRGHRILALLIDGEPAEAFPAALLEGSRTGAGQTDAPMEPLAADVRRSDDESERSRKYTAKLKIIATLLNRNYDDLRRREHERQRRRWAAGITGLLALVIVISSLAILAWYQRGVAIEQRQLAVARQLTAQSELVRQQQPALIEQSALLAAEAMKRLQGLGTSSLETDQALRGVLALLPRNLTRLEHSESVSAVAYASNGQLAAAGVNGAVSLWDAAADAELDSTAGGYRLLMSSSGARVAFASAQQPILAWQAEPAQMTGSRFQLAIPEHIAISADGQRFAFARGQAVRIWDPASNRDVTQIPLLTPVTALAMSANGDRIATVGFTPEVQIFDVATRTSVAHLVHRNMESVGQVTFGPAGSAWLATVSMTRLDMFDHRYLVSLWDLSRQTPVRQAEFRAIVDEVLIDPGGRTLAVRIEDETVRLLAIGDDRKDLILTHEDAVLAMVFEPAGRYLATLTSQGTVRVWMTDSGREVSRIARAAATASASAITFSPDGRRLAVATGNRVYIQDAIAIEEQARLEVGATVRALDFSPRLEAVAIGTGDVGSEGALHLWRPVSGGHVQRKADYNHSVETVLIDPSDTRLLAGSSDPVSCASQAQLFSLDTTIDRLLSTPLDLAEPIPGCFSSAAFSPDGDYIVGAGYNDPVARIWRTSSGRPTASLVHADVVHAVAWSPAGSGLVATAAADGRVLIWRDGKEIRGFEQGEGVTALAFGADGRHLVSGGENGVAKVWDVDSGAVLGSIVHGARVLAVAYAPDARHVATAGRDHSVRLWNMDSRQTIAQLAHDGEVEVLAFSPDAAHLATAASGGKLRIWSVPDAGEVARSLQGDVSAARFSPDGAKLITGSHDGYVRMLLWRPQDLVAEVCSRVSGNLTPAVWQRLLGDEEYVATCTAGSE